MSRGTWTGVGHGNNTRGGEVMATNAKLRATAELSPVAKLIAELSVSAAMEYAKAGNAIAIDVAVNRAAAHVKAAIAAAREIEGGEVMCSSIIVGGKYVASTVAELAAFIGREIEGDQDVCLCGTDVRKELESAGYKVEHDPFDWIATKIESEAK